MQEYQSLMLDPEVLRKFKAATAMQGRSMRAVAEELLQRYIEATQTREQEHTP